MRQLAYQNRTSTCANSPLPREIPLDRTGQSPGGNRNGVTAAARGLDWLPAGKTAAVCFSVDDVHPGTSRDAYEAGGDLGAGALGRIAGLLVRHPRLRATLFVTPDWRPIGLVPKRRPVSYLPYIGRRVNWTTVYPSGYMRVDRHPDFVEWLNGMARTEIAMHGLHHLHPGPNFAVEFQSQSFAACAKAIRAGLAIFDQSGLRHVCGFMPPAWNLPDALVAALGDSPIRFVGSARDLVTPISPSALTNMSGRRGLSLVYPQRLPASRLLHFPINVQASSSRERAFRIVDCGGLVSIKAHIFKSGGGHTMRDGLDDAYVDYLDCLFTELDDRYGDALWWTSMGEISTAECRQC